MRTCGSIRSWLASSSTTSGNCRRPTAASCWQCIGPAELTQAELAAIDGDNAAELAQRLRNLEALGYLRRPADAADESITIGNLFLASWLDAAADFLAELPASQTSENAMRAAFARQSDESTASLVAQLNARRARLVELEAVRAREFTAVSSETLEEMAQLQVEIVELRGLALRSGSSGRQKFRHHCRPVVHLGPTRRVGLVFYFRPGRPIID